MAKARSKQTYTPKPIPETGFVRMPSILAVFPVSRSTWLAGVKSGKYPRAYKLGEKTNAWKAEEIRKLIESAGRGA